MICDFGQYISPVGSRRHMLFFHPGAEDDSEHKTCLGSYKKVPWPGGVVNFRGSGESWNGGKTIFYNSALKTGLTNSRNVFWSEANP